MASKRLKTIPVYVTEDQYEKLMQAAEQEQRSLSNYLLHLGVARAKQLGIRVFANDSSYDGETE